MRAHLLLLPCLIASSSFAAEVMNTATMLAYSPSTTADMPITSATSPQPAIVEHLTKLDPVTLLAAHNPYRNELKLAPLLWSDTLAQSAQAWANHLAATKQFHHSNTEFGENLWKGTVGAYSLKNMVDAWGAEKSRFVYGHFPHVTSGGMVGHYTQMIWKTTYQVGCGIAESEGQEYLACHYDPAGNYEDEAPY